MAEVTQIGLTKDDRERPWTDREFIEIIRAHVGIPDLDVTLLNRSIWRMSMQVAETFRQGRVFLVGDCRPPLSADRRLRPEFGVQDAHNLAWKLVYVLRAGPRRPSARQLRQSSAGLSRSPTPISVSATASRFGRTDEAVRSGNRDRIRFWINDMDNHLHSIGQALGFTYEEGAVIPDGTVAKALNLTRILHAIRPARRALSASVARLGAQAFDAGLVRQGIRRRHRPARQRVARGGPRGFDKDSAWRCRCKQLPAAHPADGFQLGMRGAVLVRPDGHVAWRMPWLPADPAQELAGALSTLLH